MEHLILDVDVTAFERLDLAIPIYVATIITEADAEAMVTAVTSVAAADGVEGNSSCLDGSTDFN